MGNSMKNLKLKYKEFIDFIDKISVEDIDYIFSEEVGFRRYVGIITKGKEYCYEVKEDEGNDIYVVMENLISEMQSKAIEKAEESFEELGLGEVWEIEVNEFLNKDRLIITDEKKRKWFVDICKYSELNTPTYKSFSYKCKKEFRKEDFKEFE
ncbi:MAG: hypothetical protein ACTSQG_09125 [Promethearchaeota archaeon]